jgi:hypothetical protein
MGLFIDQLQAFSLHEGTRARRRQRHARGVNEAVATLATALKSAMIFHDFGKTKPPTVTRSKSVVSKTSFCAEPIPYQNGETLTNYSSCDSQ